MFEPDVDAMERIIIAMDDAGSSILLLNKLLEARISGPVHIRCNKNSLNQIQYLPEHQIKEGGIEIIDFGDDKDVYSREMMLHDELSQKAKNIDEFKLLPNLSHIDDGVNFGRSFGAKFIVAMQSIEQIYEAYGKERAASILSAFNTLVSFKVTDRNSISFVQERFGRNRKKYVHSSVTYTANDIEEMVAGHAIEDWDILGLKKGEAFLSISEYDASPIRFTFKG